LCGPGRAAPHAYADGRGDRPLDCLALGSSERCCGDADTAPARAALMLRPYGADGIVGLLEE
jgi:hypothetical protein